MEVIKMGIKKNQKVVLVTGGTQGIGLGIAKQFLSQNYFVIICARHEPKGKIFENPNDSHVFIKCDVSSSESRLNLVEEVKKQIGRLDVLVNNAGVAPPEREDILKAKEENFEYVIKINLQGPYFLTQKFANYMIELKEKNEIIDYSPSIITISSISSFTSSTNRGEYCVSKAGLSMMTKLFADRLAEYNIPVYEIQPGIIETPMTKGVKSKYDKLIAEGLLPIKRWGTPKDLGKASVALAEGLIPYSTGQVLNLDGGFHIRRL